MKKYLKVVLTSFFIVSLFSGAVMAADVAKIGVFDYQRFMENSKAGQKFRTVLSTKKNQFSQKLNEKKIEIKKLADELKNEAMVMSFELQEKKKREYRIKINDYEELERRYTKELKIAEIEETKKLAKQLEEILTKIGKDGNYLLIVHSTAIIYSPAQIDITDNVIKIHNKKFSVNG